MGVSVGFCLSEKRVLREVKVCLVGVESCLVDECRVFESMTCMGILAL